MVRGAWGGVVGPGDSSSWKLRRGGYKRVFLETFLSPSSCRIQASARSRAGFEPPAPASTIRAAAISHGEQREGGHVRTGTRDVVWVSAIPAVWTGFLKFDRLISGGRTPSPDGSLMDPSWVTSTSPGKNYAAAARAPADTSDGGVGGPTTGQRRPTTGNQGTNGRSDGRSCLLRSFVWLFAFFTNEFSGGPAGRSRPPRVGRH